MRHLRESSCRCPPPHVANRASRSIELLVTMAITTVILGATMAAMTDAIKATESATQITDMNNGLRTAMDLMVRDMLQVGQGLPGGRAILVPNGANSVPMQLPGPRGIELSIGRPVVLSAASDRSRHGLRGDHGGHPRARARSGLVEDEPADRHDHDARGRQLVRVGHRCGRLRPTAAASRCRGQACTVVGAARPACTRAVTSSLMTRTSPATTFVPAI